MNLRTSLMVIPLLLFASASGAITIEDLVGTYVGKWTESGLPNDAVNRYESVAIFEPDSRVTTYAYSEDPPVYTDGSSILDIEEDGSFVIGPGTLFEGLGQLTLHGKHLHVVVRWWNGTVVEFQGHRSTRLPDWVPDFDPAQE
jgi:hypothetical protein